MGEEVRSQESDVRSRKPEAGSRKISSILLLSLLMLGCLDPYQPPTTNENTDLLVIDGHINSTDNIATVKITRALALTNAKAYPPETSAQVAIEDEKGNAVKLIEAAKGTYSISRTFNPDVRHRLKIITKGKEYVSEFIKLMKNSDIDSLNWQADQNKLVISAYTHDNAPGAKYYRYAYDETHQYTARNISSFKLVNGVAVDRSASEYMFVCWVTKPSAPILLASTENLRENFVAGFPVINISRGDRRLWIKYSALVRQYSIDKEAYEYWLQMRKTTESLGSLFDPLPYQIKGNLKSTSDPEESVLGYFSGGDVTKKRITITNYTMPAGYWGVQQKCQEDYTKVADLKTLDARINVLTVPEVVGITVVGYYHTTHSCTDCRLEGGTVIKPDFIN